MSVLTSVAALAINASTAVVTQIPNPDPVLPPGMGGVTTVLSWLKWIAYAVAVAAIIIAGIMMMFRHRRGEGGENIGALGWVLGGVIVISAGGGLILSLMGV